MAGKYNIIIEQNSSFSLPVTMYNVTGSTETVMDLTGYSARAAVKKNYGDTKTYVTMSVTNTLNSTGQIQLAIAPTDTINIPVGSYVWDLLIITGSTQTRILEGVASVTPYVTL